MSPWSGAFLGAVTSALALSVFQLGRMLWGEPFAAFDIFEWLTRVLPGALITTGIDAMVAIIHTFGLGPTSVAAKLSEEAAAVALFVVGSAVLGAIVAVLGARWRAIVVGLTAGGCWLAVASIARAAMHTLTLGAFGWLALVLLGWGVLVGALVRARAAADRAPVPAAARRRFLTLAVGGVAALSGVLLAVSALARGSRRTFARATARRTRGQPDVAGTSGPARSPSREALAARIEPVPGTRPEITANDQFYRVDINLDPPHVDAHSWRLAIDGLVDAPLSLSLDELRAMPAVSQLITLECISNPVGGDLIGTSRWTGVRLLDVLERARVRDDARAIHVTAADGFYESVDLADARDPRTLLVYAMNGEPLADLHGFPLRIYIPDRHGMKLPKWITALHASDSPGRGYWVDRGWSATAIPHTTSVIDVVGPASAERVVPVGGIAYAGARGISKVEVQVDRGPWVEAHLIAPPVGPLCWVLWRYDWPSTPGRHTFAVRAYDGTGALQATEQRPPHPDGATGLYSLTRRV